MTYDGSGLNDRGEAILVRIHIDDCDPEHAYLMTRRDDDHAKWCAPIELTVTP